MSTMLLFLTVAPHLAYAQKNEHTESTVLQSRGRAFRAEIDNVYRERVESHALTVQGKNEITTLALKYIPIGTSLDDAEAILQSAGFHLLPQQREDEKRVSTDQLSILARIDSIDPEPLFPVRVYVRLISNIRGDHSGRIAAIYANFVVATL